MLADRRDAVRARATRLPREVFIDTEGLRRGARADFSPVGNPPVPMLAEVRVTAIAAI